MESDPDYLFFNTTSYNDTNATDFALREGFEPFEALSKPIQVFLICLYTVTSLLALGGNVTSIWVLMVGKRSSRELRIFLVNLALSDITMALFSIPFTYTDFMLGRWVFHPLFCPFVQFMQILSVFVSIYTLTAIGIDRYIAIMYPLSSSRWTKSRGTLTVITIWLTAFGLAMVQGYHSIAEKNYYNNGKSSFYECRENWPTQTAERVYTMTIFLITFALPMTILTFTYVSIGWKMFKHTSPGNADVVRDEAQLVAKMKVVKMLATVVILFALCWLPLQMFNILHWFHVELFDMTTDSGVYFYNGLFFACHWLAMANSFVNPIVYCFMSDNFRTDLRNMAKSCCPGYAALPVQRTNLKASGTPGAQHTGHSYASSFRTTTFIVNNTSSVKKPGQLLVSQKGPAMRATPVPDMITTSEIELVEAPSSHNARM